MKYLMTVPKRLWFTVLYLVLIPVIILLAVWLEKSSYIARQNWIPKFDLDFL